MTGEQEKALRALVSYIVDYLRAQGASFAYTKVVKLLYLIDVEYCRSVGRTLTGLRWTFHHFGPWDDQLRAVLHGHVEGIEPVEVFTSKGFQATTWRVIDAPDPDIVFKRPLERLVVDRVLNAWGDFETNIVLDHVYRDTEPMHSARFGEELDFGKVNRGLERGKTPRILTTDPKVMVKVRQIAERSGERRRSRRRWVADSLYREAKTTMRNEERLPDLREECSVVLDEEAIRGRQNLLD